MTRGTVYEQSAVIPYRQSNGRYEVALVSSRRRKHWVIPKGLIEAGLSAVESARLEAYEEAGLRGRIGAACVGTYEYRKWGGVCRVEVYLMKVEEVLDDWPEATLRERRWVGFDEAQRLVEAAGLRDVLGAAADRLR